MLARLLIAALLAGVAVALPPGLAHAIELPQQSPKARVEQQVGITQLAVAYSSPAVKGRTIWGGLVPFGEVWRTGANEATTFTSNRDFTFGGVQVPAGTYSLFTIPGESKWTVVLNSNPKTWGSFDYDPAKDVARIEVTPTALAEPRERLAFLFSNVTENDVRLDLEWEKLRVSVPVAVDTGAHVTANLEKAVADAWRPAFETARWLLDHDGDVEVALQHADASIAIKPTWWNHWVKAQLQAKAGKRSDAVKTAKKAQALGKGDRIYPFYVERISAAIAGWQK
ncbi:MAG TPA: DUF2911 domain-containing protein [Vulgatibacter sp.]|nr:DUF2911 domain-containing protein [Vulgatibacter sp.]